MILITSMIKFKIRKMSLDSIVHREDELFNLIFTMGELDKRNKTNLSRPSLMVERRRQFSWSLVASAFLTTCSRLERLSFLTSIKFSVPVLVPCVGGCGREEEARRRAQLMRFCDGNLDSATHCNSSSSSLTISAFDARAKLSLPNDPISKYSLPSEAAIVSLSLSLSPAFSLRNGFEFPIWDRRKNDKWQSE